MVEGGKMRLWITSKMTRIYRLESVRCNCYLIEKDTHYILVDTGAEAERKKIVKQLDRLGVHRIDAIFITCMHADHVGNASFLQHAYHAKVYVHQDVQSTLQAGRCIMPGKTNLWTRAITLLLHKAPLYSEFREVEASYVYPLKEKKNGSMATVKSLGKNQEVDLVIMETKGAAEGSVSILIDHEVAIVGDVMIHSLVGSIIPSNEREQELILDSWKRLLSTGCQLFLPGHGRSIKRRLLAETYSAYRSKDAKIAKKNSEF